MKKLRSTTETYLFLLHSVVLCLRSPPKVFSGVTVVLGAHGSDLDRVLSSEPTSALLQWQRRPRGTHKSLAECLLSAIYSGIISTFETIFMISNSVSNIPGNSKCDGCFDWMPLTQRLSITNSRSDSKI